MVQMKRIQEDSRVNKFVKLNERSRNGHPMYYIETNITNYRGDCIDMYLVIEPEQAYLTDDGWTSWELNFISDSFEELVLPDCIHPIRQDKEEFTLFIAKEHVHTLRLLESIILMAQCLKDILDNPSGTFYNK